MSAKKLHDECESRRKISGKKRAMKSSAHVATTGIITFSVDAQKTINDLTPETQNKIFRQITNGIADRMQTTVTGLVVHRDESAIHAHFQMPAINVTGEPLSKAHVDYGELQDIAGKSVAMFGIRRGKKKADRIADGELSSSHVNRTVKQLHEDLPGEIEALAEKSLEARESLLEHQKLLIGASAEANALKVELAAREAHLEGIESKIIEQAHVEDKNLSLVTALLTSPDHAIRSKIKSAILRHNDPRLEKKLGLNFKR